LAKSSDSVSPTGVGEVTLSLEENLHVYREVVYAFFKIGGGAMIFDDAIYSNAVFILPISLGVNIITQSSSKFVTSYFLEYRFIGYTNYEEEESLPSQPAVGIKKEVYFSGMTTFGLRFLF
jgi:hypothetical protein